MYMYIFYEKMNYVILSHQYCVASSVNAYKNVTDSQSVYKYFINTVLKIL